MGYPITSNRWGTLRTGRQIKQNFCIWFYWLIFGWISHQQSSLRCPVATVNRQCHWGLKVSRFIVTSHRAIKRNATKTEILYIPFIGSNRLFILMLLMHKTFNCFVIYAISIYDIPWHRHLNQIICSMYFLDFHQVFGHGNLHLVFWLEILECIGSEKVC